MSLFAITLCLLLVGCTEVEEKSPFTMKCTTLKTKEDGIESQTVVSYTFNKDQLATMYTSITTRVFEDKEVYETYKESQEETASNEFETISYTLKTDDDKLTLELTKTVKGLNKNAKTDDDKESIKASNILNKNRLSKATCELKGITESELE